MYLRYIPATASADDDGRRHHLHHHGNSRRIDRVDRDLPRPVARAQAARQEAEVERSAAAAHGDEVVIGAAVAGANRGGRVRFTEPEQAGWDTAERRNNLVTALEGNNDREAVHASLVADAHQGTHPSAAVQIRPQSTPVARKTITKGKGRAAERGLAR